MATNAPRKKNGKPARADPGTHASDNYKARITRGLLKVGVEEGYIVEIINYRTKRVLRRELFDGPEEAKDELARVREDIELLSTEEFRLKYLQPTG